MTTENKTAPARSIKSQYNAYVASKLKLLQRPVSLKAFAKRLVERNDVVATAWFNNKRGALLRVAKIAREKHKGATLALIRAAYKSARVKTSQKNTGKSA